MINKTDYRFFNKAKQIAKISDYHKVHVGCVAVYHGSVIGIGCNCNKTHPLQKHYNRYNTMMENTDSLLPKLHAEINCINQIKFLDINYSKVRLYIYRIRNDQPYGMARPCQSCMAAIKDLGIKDIYYTSNDGFVHERLNKSVEGDVA